MIILSIFISGCSGTINTKINNPEKLTEKQGYLIIENTSSINIDVNYMPIITQSFATVAGSDGQRREVSPYEKTAELIKQELELYEIEASIGSENTIDSDTKILVSYQDEWQRDLIMMLRYFNIYFIDCKTKTLVAEANFKSNFIHNFPTTKKEIPRMIKSIFEQQTNGSTAESVNK